MSEKISLDSSDIHYNELTSEICGSWYNYKFVSIYNAGVSFVCVSTDK